MVIHLEPSLPTVSSDLPGNWLRLGAGETGNPQAVPLFGLAPHGVYLASAVTDEAVRSYRTLSPLPILANRRSSLCCTLRRVTAPRR